ncbi:MAG TPA: glycosyltransferase [Anaerolineaceae bacterium]|nr:glycosyltransferase [Anaerolineaceae bacterium]
MKILFVVPYVPNLIRVRPYQFVRNLSEKGHQVTVLTLCANQAEREDAERLRNVVTDVVAFPLARWRTLLNCLTVLPTREPLQAAYAWHPGLSQMLDQLAGESEGFDLIHIEHLRGARYGLQYQIRKGLNESGFLPVVWDSVDSISLLFRQAAQYSRQRVSRLLTRLELTRTEYFESWLPLRFDRVLVTSPNDRQAFYDLVKAYGLKSPPDIDVLPNGVDLDYFSPDPTCERDPETLVVSGKMSYHANVSMVLYFVKEVMPRVWSEKPNVRLLVVGKDPPGAITELAKNPRIKITGTVKDIRPYLRQATLAVAPLTYGVGIQNKALEAMACGTPLISTAQAVSALQIVPDQDLFVASGPEQMALKIRFLIDHPEIRKQIGQAGRRYVEENHRWENIVDKLLEVYDEAIRSRHTILQKTIL